MFYYLNLNVSQIDYRGSNVRVRVKFSALLNDTLSGRDDCVVFRGEVIARLGKPSLYSSGAHFRRSINVCVCVFVHVCVCVCVCVCDVADTVWVCLIAGLC